MPGRTAFRIWVRSCSIVKICESRKHCHTLYVKSNDFRDPLPTSRSKRGSSLPSLLQFLVGVDTRVMDVAKSNVDAWFNHNMNADLIEEYYKGGTAPLLEHGITARFAVEGRLPPSVKVNAGVDIHLQLAGVQFRRQYFTCIWKFLACEPAPHGPADGCLLGSDDEGDDSDALAGEDSGPTAEEYEDMRSAVMERLLACEREYTNSLNRVQEMICLLDTSGHMDCSTLAQVSEEADALISTPSS
jgi:hypothetical protein